MEERQKGQLLSFKAKINTNWVNFVTIYAPPHDDNPDFLLHAKSIVDSMDGDYGLILGDFNTTMDPDMDRFGYTADNHKKCRYVMRMWEECEELIDTFRFHHPDSRTYTWHTKDIQKKFRLDYT